MKKNRSKESLKINEAKVISSYTAAVLAQQNKDKCNVGKYHISVCNKEKRENIVVSHVEA